ncbi:MAG: hypothetical protein M0P13_05770, partial [Fibrobacteraceae bacterium]|nr:hypothetical protein [Fibrobacteraceae bacterium]
RKEELLDAHERFRLSVYVSPDYVNMLITMGEFDRLSAYLTRYKAEIHLLDKEVRKTLAERLDALGKKNLSLLLKKD